MEQPPFPPPPKNNVKKKQDENKRQGLKVVLSFRLMSPKFCQEFEVEAQLVVGLAVVSL